MSRTTDKTAAEERQLKIARANVGRGHANHITLLQLAGEAGIDVICVQEPRLYDNSRTQSHSTYDRYQPVDTWQGSGEDNRGDLGRRVVTYIRKNADLRVQQMSRTGSRDLLWVNVDEYAILNLYRAPLDPVTMQYILDLEVPMGTSTIIGGDFNAKHEMWEPGVATANQGAALAHWATEQGMEFVGTPGVPMHARGLVGVMANRLAHMQNPNIQTTIDIEESIRELAIALDASIRAVGCPSRQAYRASPWWTPGCREAHKAHLSARVMGSDDERKRAQQELQRVVRAAKRAYWTERLDSVENDEELYKVMNWYKLTPEAALKAPPLVIDGREIIETEQKAEALFTAVLYRFKASDDLETDPILERLFRSTLPWKRTTTAEKVEAYTIGVKSTSPGVDRATVRLFRASWASVKNLIREIFSLYLALSYYPIEWKLAEVVILPKAGKKDRASFRLWRPIALISCIGKGLERYIVSQIAWTAMRHKVISPQHCGVLPKMAGTDLTVAFTHDAELALAAGQVVTLVTMDVQGAFDTLLKRRLIKQMIKQGWPRSLLTLIDSFLTGRQVRIRLEGITTQDSPVACGTPQGSPLSPILYTLYLAELLNQDTKHRFGYADDIDLYHTSKNLSTNVRILQKTVRRILRWGEENKVFFAPEKFELLHISRRRDTANPALRINPNWAVAPTPLGIPGGAQLTLRWLGILFDRHLTFL
ncbi:hypothetical protein EAF00_012029 [Botryotinia globosa]|nr:hypothetical protein EAF00_012029 [Botryotinia globosa]